MSDTLEGYAEKGLAGRLGFGERPATLVVDVMRGFTDQECPLGCDMDREVEAIVQLLAAARAASVPVFFTTTSYRSDMSDAGLFVHKVPSLAELREGSPWVELDSRLGRRDGEPLLEKKYASAFFGTTLASRLSVLGIDTLLLCGCTTSGCVRASVVDALQHGFRPIVVAEAVADRSADAHAASLVDIQGKYGDVVRLVDALSYLGTTAGTEAVVGSAEA